jgi:DNA-binding MarR family transcriptional regulator
MHHTVSIDRYVLETLMVDLVGHDRSPSAFLVFLALWGATGGRRRAAAKRSHRQLAEETGLSKSAVQAGIRRLLRRRLVAVSRASTTATPEYSVLRPWRRG